MNADIWPNHINRFNLREKFTKRYGIKPKYSHSTKVSHSVTAYGAACGKQGHRWDFRRYSRGSGQYDKSVVAVAFLMLHQSPLFK